MTLSRQLAFSGFIILLCLFVGMITYVVKNTQAFMNEQLTSHSQDAATALGLTLTFTIKDEDLVTAGRIVDAMWDRGYYQSIEVDAINGAPIIERHQPVKIYGVPQWFIGFIPLKTEQRDAIIMDGWRKIGVVKVESNPGFAYKQIWLTFVDSLEWFVVTALIATLLGAGLLYIILKPLRAITAQASAICNQQFPIQKRLPWTLDLRQVVEAMNNMSRRLKKQFEDISAQSEALREQAFKDPVTRLGNRRYFELQIAYVLADTEQKQTGVLLLIELQDFKGYNETFGYQAGDNLLKNIAHLLMTESAAYDGAIVAQIKGADFAIILPQKSIEDGKALAKVLCDEFAEFKGMNLASTNEIGNIGVVPYQAGETQKDVLSRADMALRAAQSQGVNQFFVVEDLKALHGQKGYGQEDWKHIFEKVIRDNAIKLYMQIVEMWGEAATIPLGEILLRLKLSENEIVSAGQFMPMAEQLNQVLALDKLVITNVIDIIQTKHITRRLTVNLSPMCLEDESFKNWLIEKIKTLKNRAQFLVIELPEYGIIYRLDKVRPFFQMIASLGAKTSIDHYGKNFTSFSYLYNMKINFLKIDGSFIRDIDATEQNQFFVRSLVDIAHSLDILVIGEAVETQAELDMLKSLNVDGVQGYVIHKPEELVV